MSEREERGENRSMNRKEKRERTGRFSAVIQVVGYFVKGNKLAFFSVAFAAIVESLCPFITVVLLGRLLDAVREGADMRRLAVYILTALGVQLFGQVVGNAARQYYNQKNEYLKEIEGAWLNRKAFTMDYEYLEDVHAQELRTRGEWAYLGVAGWALYWFEISLASFVSIVTALIIMVPLFVGVWRDKISYVSVLSVLLLAGAVAFLSWLSFKKNTLYSRKMQEIMDGLGGLENREKYYQDILATAEGQKDLRLFGQNQAVLRDVRGMEEVYRGELNKVVKLCFKKSGVDQVTSDLSGLLVYLFTGLQAYLGMITIGQVVTYAASIIRLAKAVAQFAEQIGHAERLFMLCEGQKEYMDLEKRKYEGTIPLEKRRDNKYRVEFEHVSFRYPNSDTYVIRDLNMDFVIGERMAIVGKNGSGKTTFIKLLCRLYDVTEGCIKVNGIDIRKYDYAEYCDLLSVVFQDFRIFAISLGENIACSAEMDERKAMSALEKAGLGERIKMLPEGLATYIGKDFNESGVTFSGGERQKMAIARAIYKNAPFVIMDEPTAALDPESECEVYVGFDKMVGSKTALYISHRLASCRFCQDILVFDKGQVVQRGSHEELEDQEGLYRELWNAQAQYYA